MSSHNATTSNRVLRSAKQTVRTPLAKRGKATQKASVNRTRAQRVKHARHLEHTTQKIVSEFVTEQVLIEMLAIFLQKISIRQQNSDDRQGELRLYVKQVPGDGNCLLNAICCQRPNFTPSELRRRLVQEYESNWERYVNFMNEHPVLYASKISNSGVWLDETDITALSRITGTTIELYVNRLDKPYQVYSESVRKSHSPVRVVYVNSNHYDCLKQVVA